MKTSNETIERLAAASIAIAVKGAQKWLEAKKLTAPPVLLAAAIQERVKAGLDEALADAKAALDCGMGRAAEQTFTASMVLAGMAAAEQVATPEAGWPAQPRAKMSAAEHNTYPGGRW